jgi:hypothetical protein
MSLDEQVLVIAFCAVALKLFLWPSEGGVDVEPDRGDVSHLADSGLRIRAGARPETEGIAATALRSGLDR